MSPAAVAAGRRWKAKRIAELPSGTLSEKKGSYSLLPPTSKSSPAQTTEPVSHSEWPRRAGLLGTRGSHTGRAGWCQRGSALEPGLQAVLARLEDGGFLTTRRGGCPGCVEERLRKVSHLDVTPSPATFWPLAALWLLSTQPGLPTSCCCLTSTRSSHCVSVPFFFFWCFSSTVHLMFRKR